MPHQQPVIEVRADDGHRFELIDICPARTRRTLLFLPGMGITARHYIGFAKHLAAGRTRVLIHEWRGAGSSDRRAARGSDWGYRELVQYDLSAALDTAVEAAEGEPVWAGGHSLGSQLACITAARAPQRIRGLTLVAGGLPFPPLYPWSMRLKLRALLPIIPLMSKLLGYFPGRRLGFAGSEAHGVMRDWTRTARRGHYDLETLDFRVEGALARLRLPILAMRMADDPFVSEASLEGLLSKMPECPADRACVTGAEQGSRADHFRWMKSPEPSARIVDRWLREQDEAGGTDPATAQWAD